MFKKTTIFIIFITTIIIFNSYSKITLEFYNIAIGKPVYVSSYYSASYTGEKAVDESSDTLWGSGTSNPEEWIYIDLGKQTEIDGIGVLWHKIYYAKFYEFYISNNKKEWTSIYQRKNGEGESDKFISKLTCRYVAILCYEKNNLAYGIRELEVYKSNLLEDIQKREMLSVLGGTYIQTNATNPSESFQHTISSFQMGKYEVTYELWYAVYQWAINNGYTFANAGREGNDGTTDAAPITKYEPVTTINWRDAMVWCNAYSELTGLTPIYENTSDIVIKDSRDTNGNECDSAVPEWSANGYRLPTEGESQYAASNKGIIPYNYASGATAPYTNEIETQKVAWYSANSNGSTHIVGATINSSALTLWDMSGNVWEWSWDWNDNYPDTTTDYKGKLSGIQRMLRGGSWGNTAIEQQVGNRNPYYPYYEASNIGFRITRIN